MDDLQREGRIGGVAFTFTEIIVLGIGVSLGVEDTSLSGTMRDALTQIGTTAATIAYLVALVVVSVFVLGLLNVWIFHVSHSSH